MTPNLHIGHADHLSITSFAYSDLIYIFSPLSLIGLRTVSHPRMAFLADFFMRVLNPTPNPRPKPMLSLTLGLTIGLA